MFKLKKEMTECGKISRIEHIKKSEEVHKGVDLLPKVTHPRLNRTENFGVVTDFITTYTFFPNRGKKKTSTELWWKGRVLDP